MQAREGASAFPNPSPGVAGREGRGWGGHGGGLAFLGFHPRSNEKGNYPEPRKTQDGLNRDGTFTWKSGWSRDFDGGIKDLRLESSRQIPVLRMQDATLQGRSHPCSFPALPSTPSHPGNHGVPRPSPDRCGCSGWEETGSAFPSLCGTGHPHHLRWAAASPSPLPFILILLLH